MRKNLKLKKWFSLGIITTMLLVQGSVVMAATGWVKRSGNWYYYNEKGVKTTGWQLVKGNWYYMNSKGVMQTGWLLSKNKWYYLTGSGAMKTGWLLDKNKWYYLNPDGDMKTGWLSYKNEWYYLNPNGDMKTGWLWNGGHWYYLNPDGDMATGFLTLFGKTYYLNPDGDMVSGFASIDGKKYYFNEDGSMMKNTTTIIEDVKYVFDADGVILSQTDLFQTAEEQNAISYLKKKKAEQPYAEQTLKETETLKKKARELAKQYAAGTITGSQEEGILFYKSSTLSCQNAIDTWLKDVEMEYYYLMSCNEIGFACYQKDNVYYWVCVTKDSKLPL